MKKSYLKKTILTILGHTIQNSSKNDTVFLTISVYIHIIDRIHQ